MVYRHYRLPSLTALAAFEASARHRSIHRAAAELNVTPGAVSRQIKALEEDLGAPLFTRGPTGLTLTAEAEALYAVLSQTFSRTAEVVQVIRGGHRTRRVTLACTHAFASQWLMPRMGDFWRSFPEISVDHLISDDFPRVPARRGRPAGALRLWRLARRDRDASHVGNHLPDRQPRLRPAAPRLHRGDHSRAAPAPRRLGGRRVDRWDELLRRAGIPHGALPGRRFSTLRCRAAGLPGGPGRRRRLAPPRAAPDRSGPPRALHRPGIPAPGSYHLSWNANGTTSAAAATLRDWLLAAAAGEAD